MWFGKKHIIQGVYIQNKKDRKKEFVSVKRTIKYYSTRCQHMAIKTTKRDSDWLKKIFVYLSSIPASFSGLCSTKRVCKV